MRHVDVDNDLAARVAILEAQGVVIEEEPRPDGFTWLCMRNAEGADMVAVVLAKDMDPAERLGELLDTFETYVLEPDVSRH